MTWWMIGATVLLLLILVVTVYLIYQLETIKDRITATLSPLFAISMFLLTAFKPTELPPDYVLHNQPWMETILIVSQLKDETFVGYYHRYRTHRALDMDTPVTRCVQPPELGRVREVPEVGGLHHHYERIAA